jgi:hypothetical protein
MKSYELFMDQKNRFVEALYKYDSDIWLMLNPMNLNQYNPGNWFMVYDPKCWGKYLKGFGIHFAFIYYRDSNTGDEYVRLPVGVENPFKATFRKQFKTDVVSYIKQNDIKIGDCQLWPSVGFRKVKLIEPELVELNNNSWQVVIENYITLKDFIDVVAVLIKQYNSMGCFLENRYDPA